MSYTANGYSAYSQASKIISPVRAVVMLYDGMIAAVGAARTAIEEGRIEDRFNHTKKAFQILLGLQASLDFEKGGDISPMLDGFYTTIFNKLQLVNTRNSIEICDDVLNGLTTMRQSWQNVADQIESGRAEPAPAAAANTDAKPGNQPAKAGTPATSAAPSALGLSV
ncbi:MAG: flagellar export chaperone FliS [Inquilinaceae bacterium]